MVSRLWTYSYQYRDARAEPAQGPGQSSSWFGGLRGLFEDKKEKSQYSSGGNTTVLESFDQPSTLVLTFEFK